MSNSAHEDYVRRLAKRLGWRVKKSHYALRRTHNNKGLYRLLSDYNCVLAGDNFDATLEDIEIIVRREAEKRDIDLSKSVWLPDEEAA